MEGATRYVPTLKDHFHAHVVLVIFWMQQIIKPAVVSNAEAKMYEVAKWSHTLRLPIWLVEQFAPGVNFVSKMSCDSSGRTLFIS